MLTHVQPLSLPDIKPSVRKATCVEGMQEESTEPSPRRIPPIITVNLLPIRSLIAVANGPIENKMYVINSIITYTL